MEKESLSRQSFADHVKDALMNYYDMVHLQTHLLVGLLLPRETPQETRGQALRQVLRDAISALRPPQAVSFARPEWLSFRVVWLRYVEGCDLPSIYQELTISRATFYRYHHDACEAICDILWNRYQNRIRSIAAQGAEPMDLEPSELAQRQAVRLAQDARRQWISLDAVLESVRRTILPLLQERGLTLRVDTPYRLPSVYGDPAVLRQMILNVLTETMRLVRTGVLQLTVGRIRDVTQWEVRGLDGATVCDETLEDFRGFRLTRALLGVYGGRLWTKHVDQDTWLCFTLPIGKPKTILLIDDDADTISLFERYLQPLEYDLRVARDRGELDRQIDESLPDLILLDILMPQEDGWDILQKLKASKRTASVPVVICSVLNEPRLAFALGADAVVQKPVYQETLLQTVQKLLGSADR